MTEHEPSQEQRPEGVDRPTVPPGIWDPAEQVGDVYAVEVGDTGELVRADRPSAQPGDDNPNEAERSPRPRPSIWIGSWLDYNNGCLHGEWIAADRDDDQIWADINAMLAASPTARATGDVAEDWGIFDHDDFGDLRIREQESVAWVAKVARGIATHGLAYAAWADVMEDEDLLDGFTDAYLGHHDSVEGYAEQLATDLDYDALLDDALPDGLRRYVRIDTAAMTTDMVAGGDIHVLPAEGGGVWIFDGRA